MRVPLRYLTFAVLLTDFVTAGMLPTLFILAEGSRRAGPGRYRGALEAGRKLTRALAWIVRGKALYGVALLAAQRLGWVTLSWWAVITLAALFLGWEILLEASGALRRFIRERAGIEGAEETSGAGGVGPNRTARWLLAAGSATLIVEVTLFLVVLLPQLFVID